MTVREPHLKAIYKTLSAIIIEITVLPSDTSERPSPPILIPGNQANTRFIYHEPS